jgi:DNA-binding NtrC family response regulator
MDLHQGRVPNERGTTPYVRGHGNKRKRLLIVDDEHLVHRALTKALGREYDVTTCSSPEVALRLLASDRSWDVILTDVTMPEMNGVEFARRAVESHPELADRIVLMTGGISTPRIQAAVDQSGLPVIAKPFDFAILRSLLAKTSAKKK